MKVGDTCRYDITPLFENLSFDIFVTVVRMTTPGHVDCLLIGADTTTHFVSKVGVVVEMELAKLRPMF